MERGAGATDPEAASTQALRDQHNIRSVIVNTGADQDGRTVGITSPTAPRRSDSLRKVYLAPASTRRMSGLSGLRHGHQGGRSGQSHGDLQRLRQGPNATSVVHGFRQQHRAHGEWWPHLRDQGHHDAGEGFILPNTNFETPNEIPLAKWNIKGPDRAATWPFKKRYISINNFGFGGSNASCVLEGSPLC